MSTNRSRRIARGTAELLLSGAVDDRRGGRGALADLLAAAAAPAAPRELVGEEAALTAFREAAHLAPVTQPRRRRPMASCTPARFLTAKVAAAALATTSLGGVAVAASTGNLPVVLGAGATGTATALRRLCQDWRSRGEATADPRFEPPSQAAGGPDRVDSYCSNLAATPETDTPPGTPSGTSSPDTEAPADHGRSSPDPSTTHGNPDASKHPGKPTPAPLPTDGKGGHDHTPAPPGATASSRGKQ